ncbi:MAG: hypothetical protein NTV51_05485 [Verrucomicrobia bacterium]|nr:hypothetical protein [Verrucomicrobiota bacterium]
MRSKIISVVFAVAVLVGAVRFVLKQHTARTEAEHAATEAEKRRVTLEAEVRQAEQKLAATAAERAQAQAALAARPKPVAAPARPAPAPMTALRNALLNDPQLQNLRLAAVRPKLRASYLPLFEQLGLTEAQAAQFLAIAEKRGEQEMDLAAVMETRRLPAGDPEIVTLKRQMADEFRAAQTALLGAEGWRQLEAYERSIPAREFVNEFAGAATVVGTGITRAQADALAVALTGASPAHAQGGTVTTENIDWDKALVGAAATLSAEQMAVFRNAALQFRNISRIRELAERK